MDIEWLKKYIESIDEEIDVLEEEFIEECIKGDDRIVSVEENVQKSLDIMSGIEKDIGDFGNNLENVGESISLIQFETNLIQTKTRNRMNLLKSINQFLNSAVMSEKSVNIIRSTKKGHIGEDFISSLNELEDKLKFASGLCKKSPIVKDILPGLLELQTRSESIIGRYYSNCVKNIEKISVHTDINVLDDEGSKEEVKSTEVCGVQEAHGHTKEKEGVGKIELSILESVRNIHNQFMSHKGFCFEFVCRNNKDLGEEIRKTYLKGMVNFYNICLSKYLKDVFKMHDTHITRNDLLFISEESVSFSNIFRSGKGVVSEVKESDVFYLGNRLESLHVYHNFGENNTHHNMMVKIFGVRDNKIVHIESAFILVQTLILNIVNLEYEFCSLFFKNSKFVFEKICSEVLNIANEVCNSKIAKSIDDPIGLLLCIKANQMNMECVCDKYGDLYKMLEGYFQDTSMKLWPKLQDVLDVSLNSLKKYQNKETLSILYLSSRFKPLSLIKKLSQLWISLIITTNDRKESSLTMRLDKLFGSAIGILSSICQSQCLDRKAECVFMLNNYFYMITHFNENVKRYAEKIAHEHKELLNAKFSYFSEELCEVLFASSFPILINTLNELNSQTTTFVYLEDKLSQLKTQFFTSINRVQSTLVQYFEDSNLPPLVFRKIVEKFIFEYKRLMKVINETDIDGKNVLNNVIGMDFILNELKRFKSFMSIGTIEE